MNKIFLHKIHQPTILLLIIFIGVFLRWEQLDADPPNWYSTGDIGLHIDEGYKTYSAKNLLLFDQPNWYPEDNYEGWIKKSPLTQLPYFLSFRLKGLKLDSARLVTIGYYVLLIFSFTLLCKRTLNYNYALLSAILISLDPALFHFSRVALFEIPIVAIFFLGLLLTCFRPFEKTEITVVILCFTTIISATLVKMSAILYTMPAVTVLGLIWILSHKIKPQRLSIIGILIFLATTMTLYLTYNIWGHRIDIAHIIDQPQRIFWNGTGTLSPIIAICAYLCLAQEIYFYHQRLFISPIKTIAILCIVLTPFILSFFDYHPSRYYLPIVPFYILYVLFWLKGHSSGENQKDMNTSLLTTCASMIVIAMLATTAIIGINENIITNLSIRIGESSGLSTRGLMMLSIPTIFIALLSAFYLKNHNNIVRQLCYSLLALHCVAGLASISYNYINPTNDSKIIRKELARKLSPEDIVAGGWAPFFLAESNNRSLYMNKIYNTPDQVDNFVVDFFIYSNIPNDTSTLKILEGMKNIHLSPPQRLGNYLNREILLYPITHSEKIQNEYTSN